MGEKVNIQLEQTFPCGSCHRIREPGWREREWEEKIQLKMHGKWRALVRSRELEVRQVES